MFLDSSVLLLAAGRQDPPRETCRTLIAATQHGGVQGHVSVEALQEYVYHRRRRGSSTAVDEAKALSQMMVVHPVDSAVLDEALHLMSVSAIHGRDAVHAATALLAGFDHIVTADRDFEGVPGLRCLDRGGNLGLPPFRQETTDGLGVSSN